MENPLGVKCSEPACPLVAGAPTKFCTRCGIRAKTIDFPASVDVVTDGSPYPLPLLGATENSFVEATTVRGLGVSKGVVSTPFGLALSLDLSQTADGETTEFAVVTDDARVRSDRWNPSSRRTRALHVTTRAPKIAVKAIPSVALFVEGRQEAEVRLVNTGNQTVALGPPRVPIGYECVETADAVGFSLAPGEARTVRLRHTGGPTSTMRLVTVKGDSVADVRLLPAAAAQGKTPPGFVVAIDFGTSNTSVYCRETRSGDIAPVSIMGDGKVRRETLLYAPLGTPRHLWRAIDLEGIPEASITRNLKTLLRERDEGALERVRFYLESILRGGIESELEARNPDHARRVEFVFSVPVLDHTEDGPSPEYNAYRDSLLEAARLAGYEDPDRGWSVSTIMEPDGGALDVMNTTLAGRAFTDGDRLLVIDVGGGTTDVTFGRIRLTGGRPRLEDTQNVSLGVKGKQFGGERATELLGLAWGFADATGAWPPEGPDRNAKMTENQAEKVADLVNSPSWKWVAPGLETEAIGWKTLAEPEGGANPDPKGWQQRFPDLYTEVREAKHSLSNEAFRLGDQLYRVPPYRFGPNRGNDDSWSVPYDLLEEATRRSIQEIVEGVREFLETQGVPAHSVNHVATIGGSARLPGLQRQLTNLFTPASLIPLKDYMDIVDVAVCRGASRVYQDPPPILPVGFEAEVNGERTVLARAGASLAKGRKRIQEVKAPPSRPVPVTVDLVTAAGERLPYLAFELAGYEGDVIVAIDSSQLSVRFDPPLAAIPAVVVPLA